LRQLLLAMALIITACATDTSTGETSSTYEKINFAGEKATADERAKCEAVGGIVRRAGRAGFENCIQNLPDAGEVCSDAKDCLGRCVIPAQEGRSYQPGDTATGICEATDDVFGCTTLVNNGKVEGTLCVD